MNCSNSCALWLISSLLILISLILEGFECRGTNQSVKDPQQILAFTSSTTSSPPSNGTLPPGNEAIEELGDLVGAAQSILGGGGDFEGVADNNSATYRSQDRKGREGDNKPYHGIGIIPWTVLIVISCLMGVGILVYRRWQRNYRLTRFGQQYSSPAYLSGDENILL
jgi:hypothetical protein